jgi:hypothetical protein
MKDVHARASSGQYKAEATFRQEFIEALKREISTQCPQKAQLINPVLEYKVGLKKRADTRVFNVFFEFEIPPARHSKVTAAKEGQLLDYLATVASSAQGKPLIGFVSNGWEAEIFNFPARLPSHSGDLVAVSDSLVNILCQAQSLGVVEPEDFIAVFGAW